MKTQAPRNVKWSCNHGRNILRLFDVWPIFFSPHVKGSVIIINTYSINELPNNSKLKIVGNSDISGKSQKLHRFTAQGSVFLSKKYIFFSILAKNCWKIETELLSQIFSRWLCVQYWYWTQRKNIIFTFLKSHDVFTSYLLYFLYLWCHLFQKLLIFKSKSFVKNIDQHKITFDIKLSSIFERVVFSLTGKVKWRSNVNKNGA